MIDQLLNASPAVILALAFGLGLIAFALRGLVGVLGIVIIGILAMILPNGALLIAVVPVLGVLYVVSKMLKGGMGSKSVTITAHEGGTVGNIEINM